jgi:hypothetical protein
MRGFESLLPNKKIKPAYKAGFVFYWRDENWERGRENGSFPVVEILKPQGFKERSDVRFPSSPTN